jgi:hypothetical protein
MAVRWFSMSTQFLADPKIEDLGEAFGAPGPLVIVALLGRAKIAGQGGRVTCSYRTLAHEAFADRGEVENIISAASDSGLIEIEQSDNTGASVRFPAFSRWQEAGRKAEERAARKPTVEANVRSCPELSGVVPTDKTRQTRKKEKKKASGKPSEFDSWLTHYRQTTGKESIRGSKPARTAFAARRRDGYTLEDLKAATVGCHSDDWLREKGHVVPDTILRAGKVERYIALAKQTKPKLRTDYDAKTEVIAV